jgi:hypothetical protein
MTPILINTYLFAKIEAPDSKSSLLLKQKAENGSYSNALKIRASIGYHYGWEMDLGAHPWVKSVNGTYSGNPSLAREVSRYMRALQRQKVRRLYDVRSLRGEVRIFDQFEAE